jgi:hypothetical protein
MLTSLEMLLGIMSLALLTSTVFFASLSYKWGTLILDMQDVIGESIEVLDDKCESIEKILEIPLFFDSPEIKKLHKDIKATRDTILSVADVLTSSLSQSEDYDQEQQ